MSEYPTCKCGATYDPKVGRDGGWQHRPGCVVTVCPHCGHDSAAPARSPEGWPSAAQLEAMQALVSERVPFRLNESGEIQVEIGNSFFDATKEGTTFDDD